MRASNHSQEGRGKRICRALRLDVLQGGGYITLAKASWLVVKYIVLWRDVYGKGLYSYGRKLAWDEILHHERKGKDL
jgi:hypothetical protein